MKRHPDQWLSVLNTPLGPDLMVKAPSSVPFLFRSEETVTATLRATNEQNKTFATDRGLRPTAHGLRDR